MGASSKKKGQQRKTAADATANGGISGGINGSSSDGGGGLSNGGVSNKIVAKVRRGNNYATKRLTSGVVEGFSYEHSGVLSVVLEFLNRCEDEMFHQVVASVRGDLKSPSLWIYILSRGSYVEPNCKLQIAENIGPLISCMINDTKRTFFKSNKHWREAFVPFVNLISNIMENEADLLEDEKIIKTLLQHDDLIRTVVQMGFWDTHRPDIMKELKSEIRMISAISRRFVSLLVLKGMEGESRIQMLKKIGTTPIINKSYDPNCMVSYTAELVSGLKTAGDQGRLALGTLERLITDANCVDKAVIIEIINLGTNHTSDYEGAHTVASISLGMIHHSASENDQRVVNDTRVAFAIREGLVEMCLGFIEQFSEHESFGGLCDRINRVFRSIHLLLLHKKTAKAIMSKRDGIEGRLACLEQNSNITNNSECKKPLVMIKFILGMSGRYCCRCNKSLGKTEVKQCNGCKCMIYCSIACQREDWLNGHKVTCNKDFVDVETGKFQGRTWPETKALPDDERAALKLMELETNLNMMQLKLFVDLSDMILSRAKALDIPLCDCFVHFDLRRSPPTVRMESYIDFYETPEQMRMFEETRSKENITCTYCTYYGDSEDRLVMQRFYPHEWLMKRSK